MKKTCFTISIVLAAVAAAQDTPKTEGPVRIERQQFVYSTSGPGTGGNMVYVSSEMSLSGKTVKGAPYSAQAATETTQVFADGNRIHRKSTSTIYRDSEGRTRNEMSLDGVGPFGAGAGTPQIVMINDPVAGVNYVLDSKDHTARKMTLPPGMTASGMGGGMAGGETVVIAHPDAAMSGVMGGMITAGSPAPVLEQFSTVQRAPTMSKHAETESLGKQMIGGVSADGTRTTMTIPAGEMGNDRPIEIVSERWYSPELQTVVMTRNSDPRTGETVYQLSNITRAEPLPSLFQVPGDYTITESRKVGVKVRTETK